MQMSSELNTPSSESASYSRDFFQIGQTAEIVVRTGVRQEPRARYCGMVVETGNVYLKLKDPVHRFLIAVPYSDIESARILRTRGDQLSRRRMEELCERLGFDKNHQRDGWTLHWFPQSSSVMLYRLTKIQDRAIDPFCPGEYEDDEPMARLCEDEDCVELAPNYCNQKNYLGWIARRSYPPYLFSSLNNPDNLERLFVFRLDKGRAREETELWLFENTVYSHSGELTGSGFHDILRHIKRVEARSSHT